MSVLPITHLEDLQLTKSGIVLSGPQRPGRLLGMPFSMLQEMHRVSVSYPSECGEDD